MVFTEAKPSWSKIGFAEEVTPRVATHYEFKSPSVGFSGEVTTS